MKPKFQFSNVVVVEQELIGVVVKTWENKTSYTYEVYVREFNAIKDYKEKEIQHFVYSKALADDELDFY